MKNGGWIRNVVCSWTYQVRIHTRGKGVLYNTRSKGKRNASVEVLTEKIKKAEKK